MKPERNRGNIEELQRQAASELTGLRKGVGLTIPKLADCPAVLGLFEHGNEATAYRHIVNTVRSMGSRGEPLQVAYGIHEEFDGRTLAARRALFSEMGRGSKDTLEKYEDLAIEELAYLLARGFASADLPRVFMFVIGLVENGALKRVAEVVWDFDKWISEAPVELYDRLKNDNLAATLDLLGDQDTVAEIMSTLSRVQSTQIQWRHAAGDSSLPFIAYRASELYSVTSLLSIVGYFVGDQPTTVRGGSFSDIGSLAMLTGKHSDELFEVDTSGVSKMYASLNGNVPDRYYAIYWN